MPHRRFARATAWRLREAGFSVLPTSDFDAAASEVERALQAVHFDVVLADLVDPRLTEAASILDDDELAGRARRHLDPHVRHLLDDVFAERFDKYALYGEDLQ
jgi:hypothetical protein